MVKFNRASRSKFHRWWFQINRELIVPIFVLIIAGFFSMLSVSPAFVDNNNIPDYFIFVRYLIYSVFSIVAGIAVSTVSFKNITKANFIIFFLISALMIAIFFLSNDVKGATRALRFPLFNIQPSEFMKVSFILLSAFILTRLFKLKGTKSVIQYKSNFNKFFAFLRGDDSHNLKIVGQVVLSVIFLSQVVLLIKQPDIGSIVLFTITLVSMIFVFGARWRFLIALFLSAIAFLTIMFFSMPHFKHRIELFLNPDQAYQLNKATTAIQAGDMFGRLGSGFDKDKIPDVVNDFIFASFVEDFGFIGSVIILGAYSFIILFIFRIIRQAKCRSFYQFVAFFFTIGWSAIIISQVVIVVGSNLGILPTKGMTLPFISYGGSSFSSNCIGFGVLFSAIRCLQFGEEKVM
ncbi:MAG: FtsW/RodA/SpoVE family cell cycle protein [Alphaproteobacteria bacterium]|nr:FtsW/RodA/SpoVE family cell cycle protein [Alphaproteobacteria bacterium]